jgi:carboxylesterase
VHVDADPFDLGEPGGAAVLCLHGLTGTPYEVRPPAEALAEQGLRCVGPLLPGHGQTPLALARTRRSAWTEAALDAFDALSERHDRVYVLGLSMGGVLALRLAASRPVAGLVVLAAPLDLGPWVRRTVPWLSRAIRFLPKRPSIEDSEARERHPGYDRMPLPAVAELIRLGREVHGELGRVTAPLLLIFSRRDPTVRPLNAELILNGVGSADRGVRWLTESQHVLPVDVEREVVASEVVEFVRRQEKALDGASPLTRA